MRVVRTHRSENAQWKCDFTLLRQAKLKKLFHNPFSAGELCFVCKTQWLSKVWLLLIWSNKWNHTLFVKVYPSVLHFQCCVLMCAYVFFFFFSILSFLNLNDKTLKNYGNVHLSPSQQQWINYRSINMVRYSGTIHRVYAFRHNLNTLNNWCADVLPNHHTIFL